MQVKTHLHTEVIMWDKMMSHWDDWGHPLRPIKEDIDQFNRLVTGERRLLLGSTPELIHLATEHADQLTNKIDWFNLPFPKEHFDCIFGDGVFVMDGLNLYKAVVPYLKPGGKLVVRVFLRNTSTIISDNFLIAKFQGLDKNYLPVSELYAKYGDIPTCDQYKDADDVYFFPDLNQLPPFSDIVYPPYFYGEFFPVITWTV